MLGLRGCGVGRRLVLGDQAPSIRGKVSTDPLSNLCSASQAKVLPHDVPFNLTAVRKAEPAETPGVYICKHVTNSSNNRSVRDIFDFHQELLKKMSFPAKKIRTELRMRGLSITHQVVALGKISLCELLA